jgi:hypothetical protein
MKIAVDGNDGSLSVHFAPPWPWNGGPLHIEPQPFQGVLEIDGREVGRQILTAVEPLSSMPHDGGPLHCIDVPSGRPVYWDAASGLILPGMRIREDAAVAGRHYIVQEASALGEPSGIALWSLQVEKPGRYWLWAHVQSSDANRGKFEIRVIGENGAVVPPADWLLRSSGDWQWKPLEIVGKTPPLPLDLPKGLVRISLQTRQSGPRIDRLMLMMTDDAKQAPK